jgi:hypothetical protein
MISNVQSVQRYLFGEDLERPEFQSLFNSKQYKRSATGVCGSEFPFSQRVQVNLIVMLPGQDLPMHYDLPWFLGESMIIIVYGLILPPFPKNWAAIVG